MHHKINAENTNSNTEKCSPGCPAYFHTVIDNHPRVACDNQPRDNIAWKLLFLDYAICVTDCCTESLW